MSLFYASCDSVHREFFSALLYDWQDSGQVAEAAAEDNDMQIEAGAMQLRVRSVGRSDQNEDGSIMMPCLFVLHAGGGAERARITINLKRWREWFGPEIRDEYVNELNGIQGLQCRARGDEFAILEPAHLSGPTQQRLRDLIVDFGRNSRETLGY